MHLNNYLKRRALRWITNSWPNKYKQRQCKGTVKGNNLLAFVEHTEIILQLVFIEHFSDKEASGEILGKCIWL